MNRQTVLLTTFTVFFSAMTALPASAGQSWNLAASGIFGGSLPLKVDGLRVSDPTVPLDLTIDGGVNKKAPVVGGRFSAFKRRDRGMEWGFDVDVRTFRYDGKAGQPTHVTGSVEGMRIDEIELSAGDQTRVTMLMGALLLRFPLGRTTAWPDGRWVPYAGIGAGNQHAHIKNPEPSFRTNAPTLQLRGGGEMMVTPRIGLFGEYRFERLSDEVTTDTTRVNIQLRTNHVAGGVSVHF